MLLLRCRPKWNSIHLQCIVVFEKIFRDRFITTWEHKTETICKANGHIFEPLKVPAVLWQTFKEKSKCYYSIIYPEAICDFKGSFLIPQVSLSAQNDKIVSWCCIEDIFLHTLHMEERRVPKSQIGLHGSVRRFS